MSDRVRVKFSPDGSLPDGVVLASIHENRRGRGWYCITPGDVAHGPYLWDQALFLVRHWVNNFLRPWAVDWSFCQHHSVA